MSDEDEAPPFRRVKCPRCGRFALVNVAGEIGVHARVPYGHPERISMWEPRCDGSFLPAPPVVEPDDG